MKIGYKRYFAIFEDMTQKQFSSLKEAIDSNPAFLAVGVLASIFVTSYGNEHQILNYSFIDKNEIASEPIINDWRISKLSEGYWVTGRNNGFTSESDLFNESTSFGPGFKADFLDPNGTAITKVGFSPLEMIEFLTNMSIHANIKEYKLFDENRQLVIKVKILENKLAQKEKEIKVLKGISISDSDNF